MIDISKIKYDLVAILPSGAKIRLYQVINSLSWEENEDELAVRLQAEIQNTQLQDGSWLHKKIPLGTQVVLLSDWGIGWKEVFRGTVFAWEYMTDPLGHFTITAYDQLIYLTKSQDDRFYKAGQTGKAIIQDIAKAWNIPIGTIQGPNAPLSKQVFRGETIADMFDKILEESQKKGSGKWIIRSKAGKIDVIKPGQNSPVYYFSANENVSSVQDHQDIEDLVTRVRIIGGDESKESKLPVVATLDGRTEFGILQQIVYQRQYDNLADAKKAAQEILKEKGKPTKQRKVVAPDLPFLRKGDKVKIEAGTLIGYYIVSGVTHNADDRTMTMEVKDLAEYQ